MTDELLAQVRRRIEAGENLQKVAFELGISYQQLYRFLRESGYRKVWRKKAPKTL